MTVKKKISKTGPSKNDGKKGPNDQLQCNKMTVKSADYTKKLQRMLRRKEKRERRQKTPMDR